MKFAETYNEYERRYMAGSRNIKVTGNINKNTFIRRNLKTFLKRIYYNLLISPLWKIKNLIHYSGEYDLFNSIALETTTYCNLRCKFCPNSIYERGLLKNRKLMDIKLFKKIIKELSYLNYNGSILLHFYGEPLTDKRLPELVKYIKTKIPEAKIKINTNGFLLTPKLYKQLLNKGVDSFFITQYGDIMPENIKMLLSSLPKEHKIIYRQLNNDTGLSNRGGEIKVSKCVDYEKPVCTYPTASLCIDYDGNIVLCCNDYHSSIKLGNVRNEKLLDIWRKPHYQKLRKEISKGIYTLPICQKCVGLASSKKDEGVKV